MPRASQAPDLESVVEVGESETGPAAWQVVPYPRALQGSPPPQQSSSSCVLELITKGKVHEPQDW